MKAPRLLILESVTTTFFVVFTGTATANRGNDAETVRLSDDCDARGTASGQPFAVV
jgi:PKD repeat protein